MTPTLRLYTVLQHRPSRLFIDAAWLLFLWSLVGAVVEILAGRGHTLAHNTPSSSPFDIEETLATFCAHCAERFLFNLSAALTLSYATERLPNLVVNAWTGIGTCADTPRGPYNMVEGIEKMLPSCQVLEGSQ
ncbi:hypothetical protein OF83DRAFT_1081976 [Amylostereum chailletii]|nr:hypothetical protein OF83DRAFT_1081976 [Amylostereum chailletii]